MKQAQCKEFRWQLGAFVDGELSGAEMLPVSQHLEACARCADEVRSLRRVGEILRGAAALAPPAAVDLGGLAGGVVSRVRAEQAQSWWATLGRAVEDWHWVVVGAGSVTATFASAMLVFGLVLLAPKPEREDSLHAVLNNLASPAGTLFVLATPVGRDQESMVMQFDNGMGSSEASPTSAVPAQMSAPTDGELARWLDLSLVTPDGRLIDVRKMSENDRRRADGLLDEIRRRVWFYEPARSSGGLLVHRLELVANTSVTAKPL